MDLGKGVEYSGGKRDKQITCTKSNKDNGGAKQEIDQRPEPPL